MQVVWEHASAGETVAGVVAGVAHASTGVGGRDGRWFAAPLLSAPADLVGRGDACLLSEVRSTCGALVAACRPLAGRAACIAHGAVSVVSA